VDEFSRFAGVQLAPGQARVDRVEATSERYVLEIPLGRGIIEPEAVRFHRNDRGRGLSVVGGSKEKAVPGSARGVRETHWRGERSGRRGSSRTGGKVWDSTRSESNPISMPKCR
jgi:hypothetical protein